MANGGRALALALVVLVCSSRAMAEEPPAALAAAHADPATVQVVGDTLYYRGNLSSASSEAFDAATAGLVRGQLTRLVIASVGGDTQAGRKVARWVRNMALVVEVDTICFSSCANYIFPAGRARVIRADALVGWHGNERGLTITSQRNKDGLREVFRKALPAEFIAANPAKKVEATLDEMLAWNVQSNRDEADFYAELGIKDAFATCAVGNTPPSIVDLRDKQGWSFSLQDMERLGMPHTVYLGDGDYEKSSTLLKQWTGLLSARNCLALAQRLR